MCATDYRCKDEEMATVPYIAHQIILHKHKRREKVLTIALIISVLISIVSNILKRQE